uniref:Uncharacterized protein n=1 Tax=Arundo donax TaxID=35708 RepID=A0A0A9H738_ARUDO
MIDQLWLAGKRNSIQHIRSKSCIFTVVGLVPCLDAGSD